MVDVARSFLKREEEKKKKTSRTERLPPHFGCAHPDVN